MDWGGTVLPDYRSLGGRRLVVRDSELSSGEWRGHASPFPREMLTPHPLSHHGVGRCWVRLTSVPHFYPFPEIRAKFQGGLEEDKENWEGSVKIKENLTEVESGG